ncbi:uncharacterized protein LOC127522380 [Ctenopharyngodon idella]|uniref:uncharacterized protein LOC127522380 n=1 Tax=Ctenopharyngodon idella TaxID=7959 RepID=UPI00222E4BC2|nr:uncharacterized protein LOC127522380 [Ctenopharyngodon idella]
MELFIFIAFQLLMEVQSYKYPALKVSPDVISESSSVKMICKHPAGVTVDLCYFYINRDEKNIKSNWSCELSLTGAEVLKWAAVKSSVSININCYYKTTEHGINKPSSHSPAVTVKVKGSATTTTARTTTTTTTAQTTTTTLKIPLTVKSTSETTTYSKTVSMATSTLPDVLTAVSTEKSTHKPSQTNTETSTTAVTSTTETPTSTRTAVSSVHTSTADPEDHPLTPLHRETWFMVLVSTGVGVILTGFICLCRFASKKRRKLNKIRSIRSDVPSQEIGMSSGPAETYSVITSVPATSQPISVGLEHPDSHQDNTPDPTATSSFIMAENSIYQPSEDLVNTQQKEGNTGENENVYHLYCTIPDKPVHSNAADQVYSLVKMH